MKPLWDVFVQHRVLPAAPGMAAVLVLAFAVPLAIAAIALDEAKPLQTVKVVRQNGASTLAATPVPGVTGSGGAQCLAVDLGGDRGTQATGPVGEWIRCIAFCAKICGNSETITPRECFEDCKSDYCDKLKP
jgi:hypothetical protein